MRYAQLESGADGYGEMYFDDAAQEYVVPSLPGKVMPPVIPEQVTRLQARLALIQVGLWETVVSYFANPKHLRCTESDKRRQRTRNIRARVNRSQLRRLD